MLYVNIPYCPKTEAQDLGKAYNTFMSILDDNDWACFLDHDAMFTTVNWYHQIEDIINQNPNVGVFTAITNRIGNPHQRYIEKSNDRIHDIKLHRAIGKTVQERYKTSVKDLTDSQLISGVVLVIKKKTWQEVGGFKCGFLGVDNDIHQKCKNHGYKVLLMQGVYVYHWYRGDGDISHLK
jgi:GT2 family glycosyltransferase